MLFKLRDFSFTTKPKRDDLVYDVKGTFKSTYFKKLTKST